ncbi:MAG TPA: hypothetical protein VL614_04050 [Acetobacteraceae bacterium]|jgi:hypothetical protein|nr:hypothetical protein [Acetobacteraceae bacterium]
MNRRGLCRPSLKITRSDDQAMSSSCFRVEVWNPFVHGYQPVTSFEEGVIRVSDLANLICRMWTERHPKRDALMDVPVATEMEGRRWAELRINATTFRSYDIRSSDRLNWTKATGVKQAAATICVRVGYVLQKAAAP